MSAPLPSLLTFLETPVVVGDPDGRVAYVNPAFASRFATSEEQATGEPLAALFEGGAREAVLRSVAEVCEGGHSARFFLRQADANFDAIASPIVAEDSRVGVIILLTESSASEERLLAINRELQEPLERIGQALDELLEQTGGRREERFRGQLEEAMRALERVRKWSEELRGLLSGGGSRPADAGTFDPLSAVRQVAARVGRQFSAIGAELELLVPAQLPPVRGDAARLEMALTRLLRNRLEAGGESASVTLTARRAGREDAASVVISIVDAPAEDGQSPEDPSELELSDVVEAVRELGGELHTTADPVAGRTTAIRLSVG